MQSVPRVTFSGLMMLGTCIWSGGCVAASSGNTELHRFELAVRVESDPGKAIAAARLYQGGTIAAHTAADGIARVVLTGHNGDNVMLRVACPEGYVSPSKPLSISLRPLVSHGLTPTYHASCQPLLRTLVVAVRVKGAAGTNLPLKHLGLEIARTDAEGTAHALLEVPPTESVTLVLDTTDAQRLRPKSPEFRVIMPAHDRIAVFDQAFTQLLPPPAAKIARVEPKIFRPIKIERPQ
jgi:hypothetical protein